MSEKIRLQREQLNRIVGDDPDAIRVFEKLLTTVNSRGTGPLFTNSKTITESVTVPSDKNAMSAGPITIASGVTVTLEGDAVWVVV